MCLPPFYSSWQLAKTTSSNWRAQTVITGFSGHLLGYIFNRSFTNGNLVNNKGLRYFGVVWTQTFGTFSHPLNIAWMSLTCPDSEVRALAMAMIIMGANIAGIYGAQILRSDDSPLYRRGFTINCALLSLAIVLSLIRFVDDRIRRKKNPQLGDSVEQGSNSDDGSAGEKIAHAAARTVQVKVDDEVRKTLG